MLNGMLEYLYSSLKKLGLKSAYVALLLFYAYRDAKTPGWAKKTILGALAYVLAPFDMITDLAPFIGFTDDAEIMSLALVTISCYVNDDVREKANLRLRTWTKGAELPDFSEIDRRL